MKSQQTIELLRKYLDGKATTEEKARIDKWYASREEVQPITEVEVQDLPQVKEQLYQRIITELAVGAKVVPLYKKTFFRAVAAAIVIAFLTGGYFLLSKKNSKQSEIVKVVEPAKDVEAPKNSKAMITLANGQKILLDSISSGMLVTQGDIKVVKTADGQIVYSGAGTEVLYNTLSNPRGSKAVSLSLIDGTKVWLNSESSIKYPTAFISNERSVEITGEAYFEVAKDATKKFIVTGNGVQTEVLGTHFNVNAYAGESSIKVTLLEGAVKITKGSESGLLKPGQQAQINDGIKIINNPDIEQVMAWKNGLFNFNKTEIGAIMRQVGRWYDMEVEYEGSKPDITLSGIISRDINVSRVLEMMQLSGVHFKIEGKKIIVKP